ncbi:MAG: hydroxymethylglutaryl-CoA lyase [Polyangiaceae bacterium]
MELFGQTAPEISVYEVGPRDGLQNEKATVPLQDKLRLVEGLVSAGLRRIEITSFVSPKWIPQLADADEVATRVRPADGVVYSALCPNAKGLERAAAAKLPEVAVFLSASETHNKKNVNKTIEETLAAFSETIGPAIELGMRVRGYVSTVWGCPYEGDVDPKASIRIAKRLFEMGCYQVSLGDTIGSGTPKQTEAIMKMMLSEFPTEGLAMHMHDTRGTALANIVVGLELGIRHFDSAVGGMGGCPYAPGAAGNVATEDLVYMLDGMGLKSGVDLGQLLEVGKAAESIVGRKLPSKVLMAGARSLRA